MSRARQALLACLALAACERLRPAPPPSLTPQEQVSRAVTDARAASARRLATSPLPGTSQALPPTRAAVLLWVNDAGTVLDDASLLDSLPSSALTARLEQRRGFGPRAVPDLAAELRAVAADARPPRDARQAYWLPHGSFAAAPDLPARQVLLVASEVSDLDDGHLFDAFSVAVRGDGGVVDVEAELWAPRVEPERCAHVGDLPTCALPELELSSRGWCARPARGWVGFPCLLGPVLGSADRARLAALLSRLDAGLVGPDLGLGLSFPRGPVTAPRKAGPPPPEASPAVTDEQPCEPVPREQLLARVAELVARRPGCVRSRVTAVGQVRWGALAPVLAELAANGLPARVEWRPDDADAPDGGRP